MCRGHGRAAGKHQRCRPRHVNVVVALAPLDVQRPAGQVHAAAAVRLALQNARDHGGAGARAARQRAPGAALPNNLRGMEVSVLGADQCTTRGCSHGGAGAGATGQIVRSQTIYVACNTGGACVSVAGKQMIVVCYRIACAGPAPRKHADMIARGRKQGCAMATNSMR